MTDSPSPIDVTGLTEALGDSREFMRVWAKQNGPVTCIVDAYVVGPDPFLFGMAMVDCVRHGANAYAQALGMKPAEIEARIWEGLDAERAKPTDTPRQVVPKKEIN